MHLLWQWRDRRTWPWAALTGLALGAAYLVRPDALLVLPAAAVCAYLWCGRHRRKLAQIAVLMAAFSVMALPYMVYLHAHTGRWQLTNKTAHNLAIADARSTGVPWPELYRLSAQGELAELAPTLRVAPLVRRVVRNEVAMLKRVAALVSPILFAFTGAGLILIRRGHGDAVTMAGTMVALGLPLLYLPVFFWEDRMLVSVCALAIILGVHGMTEIAQLVREPSRTRVVLVATGLAAAFLLYDEVASDWFLCDPPPRRDLEAGRWVGQRFPGRTPMVSRSVGASFAAGKLHRPLPYEPLGRGVEYARKQNAELMLLPKNRHEPSVCEFAQKAESTPELEVVHEWESFTLVRLRSPSPGPGLE